MGDSQLVYACHKYKVHLLCFQSIYVEGQVRAPYVIRANQIARLSNGLL